MMMNVLISNEQEKQEIDESFYSLIEKAIHETLAFEGYTKSGEVSVTLTDNEGIHLLNKQYRGIDRPTDVLSFPLFDEVDADYVMLGDIVLSMERAKQQAEECQLGRTESIQAPVTNLCSKQTGSKLKAELCSCHETPESFP